MAIRDTQGHILRAGFPKRKKSYKNEFQTLMLSIFQPTESYLIFEIYKIRPHKSNRKNEINQHYYIEESSHS